MKEYKNIILNLIGIYFILLGIFSMVVAVYLNRPSLIVWFCYIGLILTGFGIFYRKDFLIVSQLNILLIPLIIWNIDFFYELFTGKSLIGITHYFFIETLIAPRFITLQHVYVIPVMIFCLCLIKIKSKDTWKFSFIEMLIIFIVSRLFTNTAENLNCVFYSCANILFNIPPVIYGIGWTLVVLLMIIISDFIIKKIGFLKIK